jgi:hypothetical protein
MHLMTSSGQDLTAFFEDWVFNPGFPGIFVDSFVVASQGNEFHVTTYIRQKLREAPAFYSGVPMQITYTKADKSEVNQWITVNGEYTIIEATLPFEPALVYLNKEDGILQAVTGENVLVSSANTTFQNYAYFRLVTTAVGEGDTALVRIQHHRVAPEPFQNGELNWMYQLSSQRYWSVDGIWDDEFVTGAWLFYDGRNIAAGNLDRDFIDVQGASFSEDSLVLLWRPNRASEWQVYPHAVQNKQGSATDGSGRFVLDALKKGEYTFAYRYGVAVLEELNAQSAQFTVYPNPGSEWVNVEWLDSVITNPEIRVFDGTGKLVKTGQLNNSGQFSISELSDGTHFVHLYTKGKSLGTVKFVKQ